jgi:hypothetical protein
MEGQCFSPKSVFLKRQFSSSLYHFRSQDSSVSIATGYGLDGQGSIWQKQEIFLYSTASRLALGLTQPPIQWVPGAFSLGVKQLGHEADHSPPSIAEVKNGGPIPPLPNMSSWHGA